MPEPVADSDPLTRRVEGLVEAGLAVGASVARGLARATGSDAPKPSAAPLDDIVTFGSAAALNLLRRVTAISRTAGGAGVKAARGAAAATAGTAPGGAGRDELAVPRIAPGSTLRLPLLVENTSHAQMGPIDFAASVSRIDCPDQPSACSCLPGEAVTFFPPTLTVGPKDFEKLTVRVATDPTTPSGDYVARVQGGDGWFNTTIVFALSAQA